MYVPPFNAVEDNAAIREMVAAISTAEFVTVDDTGVPQATLLPIRWHEDVVIAHLARANPQWRGLKTGSPALLICCGAQAYVSPSWYAATAEHGRVVPTWNYSSVHLTGTVRVHEDVEWLRRAVTELTERHESYREQPWHVTDAPGDYIDRQLRAIVGLEVTVTKVEAKTKLSQNRSVADRVAVIDGLEKDGAIDVAAEMTQNLR